jgi:hypothetical protein
MKTNRWIILGTIACIVITAGAYFWATAAIGSLYAFRSPLHDNPLAPGQPLGHPLTHRVVFFLIDALRDDTSHKPEVMPFLNELRGQGAWATVHSRTPSYSDPGWSALMIGAWPDISDGPAMNTPYDTTPTWTQDNLFSAAHRHSLKTAFSGFFWWKKLIPQADVDASFYTQGEDQSSDREVVDTALTWLQNEDYHLVVIHLEQVDNAGHNEGGPRDPRWDAAAMRADGLLKEIVSSLDFSRDTVLVVSDHGQIDRGGHGGQEAINLIEPFVLVGAGVKPGEYPDIQQVDVAPTVAALLGLNIPATAQGIVQTDMLTLTDDQKAQIGSALLAQKSKLAADYLKAIGASASLQPMPDSVSGLIQAMDAAKASRLNTERIPRFGLALLLAAIPAIVLIKKRGKTIAWLLGGALLYLVLFNVRYAILDGRTYSLSSVASSGDLIGYAALTAGLALIIAWLVTSIAIGSFKTTPRQAAETTLALTFVILYLLSLPILWSFALNGALGVLIIWTLPDVASAFLGVLFTLQSLVVAAAGMVLTGVTALIAFSISRKS